MTRRNDLLQSLASNLITQVGNYFQSIEASTAKQLSEFNAGETQTSVYLIYSASGQPLAVGHIGRSYMRGRQAPPPEVVVLREVRGTTFRLVEVGDEGLAENLARLLNEMFEGVLPFSTIVSNVAVADDEVEVAAAPRRRGPAKGKLRGRRAVSVQTGEQEGGDNTDVIEQPRRRGRKRGSKNESKDILSGEAATGAPRRGRKPGSKNRPKESLAGGEPSGATQKRRPGKPRKNAL